jgi:thymidylate synthase (FAD)
MKIIEPSYEIIYPNEGMWSSILEKIEDCGRVCYKSEGKATVDSSKPFVRMLIKRGHESVIEHASMTVKFICDRGISHELVRHRLASFSQESTRYVRYDGAVEGKEITFIRPCFWPENDDRTEESRCFYRWKLAMEEAECHYIYLLGCGAKPEEARSVLPNSLKTEIVVTANLREWRLIFKQRTSNKAHPQMRQIMIPLLNEVKIKLPVVFDDI